MKKACCFVVVSKKLEFLARFAYSKLLRILSYCFRFYDRLYRKCETVRNNKIKNEILCKRLNDELHSEPLHEGRLRTTEINKTEKRLIKSIQNTHFHEELRHISRNVSSDKGRFSHLSLFVDRDGLLRVGGRLKRANIDYDQRHPILLPGRNMITDKIIRQIHENNYHTGIQTTLNLFRQNFWVTDGRNQVRKIVRDCIKCFRFNAKTIDYLIGDLPAPRVQANRPFSHVGIDFCGPFYIKEKKFRIRNRIKTYVCVFICISIKAVHLEVVSDLTTQRFIDALKRFFSRRGFSSHIYSDNGSNFVGANNQLNELYDLLKTETHKDKINQFALENRITWHFNPPLGPSFGGLWESTVKIFKHHLKQVVGDLLVTYEEFITFVTGIEAILNSRPISPMSSDPNDLLALTPAHYFIGEPMRMLPENDLLDIPANKLSTWEHLDGSNPN